MNLFRVILFQSKRFPEIFRGKVDDLVLIVLLCIVLMLSYWVVLVWGKVLPVQVNLVYNFVRGFG